MSLFKKYGIFSLPLGLMALFGLLGQRPGELFTKYPSLILNLYVAFTCVNIIINDTGHVIKNYDFISVERFFYAFYYGVTLTSLAFLLYKMYKEYNLYSLLNDIISTCNCTLKKNYAVLMYLSYILILSDLCYYTYYCVKVFKYFTEVRIFTMKVTGKSVTDFFLVHHVSAIISSWMCVICTNLLLCIICLVISENYDVVSSVLKERIRKNRCLTDEAFSEATQRFYELADLVGKIDDMFSDIVGITFCLSLVILCCAIYAMSVESGTIEGWSVPTIMSLTMLFVLLTSAPTLHSRVSLKVFLEISFDTLVFPFLVLDLVELDELG